MVDAKMIKNNIITFYLYYYVTQGSLCSIVWIGYKN